MSSPPLWLCADPHWTPGISDRVEWCAPSIWCHGTFSVFPPLSRPRTDNSMRSRSAETHERCGTCRSGESTQHQLLLCYYPNPSLCHIPWWSERLRGDSGARCRNPGHHVSKLCSSDPSFHSTNTASFYQFSSSHSRSQFVFIIISVFLYDGVSVDSCCCLLSLLSTVVSVCACVHAYACVCLNYDLYVYVMHTNWMRTTNVHSIV